MSSRPTIVFGAAGLSLSDLDTARTYIDIVERHGIKNLDTARIYGDSEAVLGKLEAPQKFIIDTKVPGGFPGLTHTREDVNNSQKASFENLKVESVDIFYLHAPTDTPFEETLAAINDLHKAGRFKRFGLSNFTAAQVKSVHAIASANNYVLPTVYQGNYNPVTRHSETDLFPVLRSLNISIYAYSPMAGGLLAKSAATIRDGQGKGRWDPNAAGPAKLYTNLYNKPKVLEGLEEWSRISEETGIPKAELAYRWTTYHSVLKKELGDAVIVGASRPEQLETTLKGLENGPLPQAAVDRVNSVWETVKDDAPSTDDILGAIKPE